MAEPIGDRTPISAQSWFVLLGFDPEIVGNQQVEPILIDAALAAILIPKLNEALGYDFFRVGASSEDDVGGGTQSAQTIADLLATLGAYVSPSQIAWPTNSRPIYIRGNQSIAIGAEFYFKALAETADGGLLVEATQGPEISLATETFFSISADGSRHGYTIPQLRALLLATPMAFGDGDWDLVDLGTTGDARITILSLPYTGDLPITLIEYQIDGGSWVSLGGVTVGNYDLAGFTDGVEADVALRVTTAAGTGNASETKPVITSAPSIFLPPRRHIVVSLAAYRTAIAAKQQSTGTAIRGGASRAPRIPAAFGVLDWDVVPFGSQTVQVTMFTVPPGDLTSIEYRIDGGSWVSAGTTVAGSFTVGSLTNDVSVTFELRASSADGAGADSDDKPVTPSAPTVSRRRSVSVSTAVYRSTL